MASRANNILAKTDSLLTANFRNTDSKFEEPAVKMSVPIINDSLPYLSYSFDKSISAKEYPKGLFPFLKKNKGVHSMCDYMLFCFHSNKLFVLLVELKHGQEGVMPQLNSGKCLAKFIVDTLNRVENMNLTPEIRLISIRNSHIINKRPTKIREVEYYNDFYTFEGCRFHLKEFLK